MQNTSIGQRRVKTIKETGNQPKTAEGDSSRKRKDRVLPIGKPNRQAPVAAGPAARPAVNTREKGLRGESERASAGGGGVVGLGCL